MSERSVYREHGAALGIALAAFVGYLAIAYGVFRGFPFCMDEYGYWYQAELFARGATAIAAPGPELLPLREMYVVWHDGVAFSKYPPGFSLVLALGSAIGAPAAINPLIGAITLLLVYVVTLRLVGKPYALIAQLLLATNPYFVAYSASYFAHSLTLALTLALIVLLADLADPAPARPRRWLAVGVLLGAFAWVRPLDALAASTLVAHAVVRAVGWRRAFVAGLWALGPFVALVLAMMFYNQALSGRFALSTYPVLAAEFRLVAGENLSFWDNLTTIADEYVRRLVHQGKVLWGPYFLWPTALVVPLLALAAIFLRAGDRGWRLVLWTHFVVVVLLYNFHAMASPVPTWPQYGVRYWYAGFGGLVVLAAMAMRAVVERPWGHAIATPRVARALVGAALVVQLAIGVSLFGEYGHRFDVVFAVHRDIAQKCPGKRVVGLELPGRVAMPAFVRANDFRRNPFFDGERLYVIGSPTPAVMRALPGYTACHYDFSTWPSEL